MKALKFILVAGLVWLTNSCGNPLEDFAVHMGASSYNQILNVVVHDFDDPDNYLTGASLSISGPNSDAVYAYDATKTYDISDGYTSLILNPSFDNKEGAFFNIKIEKAGYFTKTVPIIIAASSPITDVDINLISEMALPLGASRASSTQALSGQGALVSNFTLNIAPTAGVNGAQISLPAGTEFYASNGNRLMGNSLEVETIYFEGYMPLVKEFKPSFDGLLPFESPDSNYAIFDEGNPVLKINMTIDGQVVKSFQNGVIQFSFDLPADAPNVKEDRALLVGDSVQLISNDENSQTWEVLGSTVVESGPFGLRVVGESSHLSIKSFSMASLGNKMYFFFAHPDGTPVQIKSVKGIFELSNGKSIEQKKNKLETYKVPSSLVSDLGWSIDRLEKFKGQTYYGGTFSAYGLFLDGLISGNAIPQNVTIEIETPNGTFNTYTLVDKVLKRTKGFTLSNTNTVHHYIMLEPLGLEESPLKAQHRISCTKNPNLILYPPIGTKIKVWESFAKEDLKTEYVIPEKNWTQFEAYVESGQEYWVEAYLPLLPNVPLFSRSIVIRENEIHPIELTDAECNVLSLLSFL